MASMVIMAQTLNIKTGSVTYTIPATQAGEMLYSNGSQLTVMGKELNISTIDKIFVDDTTVEDNTVNVTYEGTSAKVAVAGNIAKYVDVTVDGAKVSVIQSSEVGETTCGEITYTLSGTSDDGQFYTEGAYKATIALNGLTLTNTTGAPLDIQNNKRVSISVKTDTENTLTDCSGGTQKGCIVCKGHIEFKSYGTLNVYGNTGHAIYAKEYVTMKNCTINVLSAVKDGINCNQYFTMTSGNLSISNTGDDGVQAAFKDDTDREAEDTGSITISGGTVTIDVTATAAKALKADGSVFVTNGTLTLSTSGGGMWDAEDVKTKGASCISADGNIQIDGGTLNLTSTGCAGKGLSCDTDLLINGGEITINTTGGVFVYKNGTEYSDYTGNTDNIASDYKSSPKGIKADGNVTISGGVLNVSSAKSEGIESKAVLTINDGTVFVSSYDDAINSSSHMYINGGDVTVIATNNDGIDANGNIYVAGGKVMAFGASSPECGIDANSEEGYSVYFTGGTLLAVGGGNSVPSSNSSSSTQPYVSSNASVTANSTVKLSSGSDVLAEFVVPSTYSGSSSGGFTPFAGPGGNRPGSTSGGSLVITCPGLTSGNSYTLTYGTSSTTVSAK